MMFNKLTQLFKAKENPAALYLHEHRIQYDPDQGYIVDGVVLNQILAERLVYFSNRRMHQFNDLKELYFTAMLINEKIDLEIATEQYVMRLGNTHENLLQFKHIVKVLNDYYREFIREKR